MKKYRIYYQKNKQLGSSKKIVKPVNKNMNNIENIIIFSGSYAPLTKGHVSQWINSIKKYFLVNNTS